MEEVLKGHLYTLNGNNSLRFMKRVAGKMEYDGTTNEEVLEVLLNRLNYLQEKLPCQENTIAIHHISTALSALKLRTQKREVQLVETTDIPHRS